MSKVPILYVSHLKKHFSIDHGFRKSTTVKAVDDITFTLFKGETLGIVGETGCGKTTLGRTILRLTDSSAGDVYFDLPEDIMNEIIQTDTRYHELLKAESNEANDAEIRDLEGKLEEFSAKYSITRKKSRELKPFRKKIQPVFQDPFGSLDPKKLIKDIISEPMKSLTNLNSGEIFDVQKRLVEEIGLSEDHLYRFPHEFSGGQRQRIGIIRSMSVNPEVLVLDEPTSALDVSVQAQILNTLMDLQNSRDLSYLFISHNLSVIRMMSDRVAVMYLGKVVELAETGNLFQSMLHPYTKSLLLSIPQPDPKNRKKMHVLEGEIPSPSNPPKGCYFHPRCAESTKYCGWSPSDLAEPLSNMLVPFRNPEMSSLPHVESITPKEDENTLLINFEAELSSPEEAVNIIRSLMKKEAAKDKLGAKYDAISQISVLPDMKSLQLDFETPRVPTLKEVKKNHFAACILYDEDLPADAAGAGKTSDDIEIES